jgi:hypothetical protein
VLNAIWIDDRMAVAGGFVGPAFTSTILVFDGATWAVADIPEAAGQVTGIARLGERLIAGGNQLPDVRNGFIWQSTDGRSWEPVRTIPNAALYDLVVGKGVLVAAGARLDVEMNATASVWTSTDGTTWSQARVAGARGPAMGTVAATSAGFAASGDRPLGQPRPFWRSSSGATWAAIPNDLNDQLLPIDLVQWNDELILVGASGRSGDQHPFVARSPEGRRWVRINLSEAEGYASAVTVTPDGPVIAGVDADVLTLWRWRDATWQPEAIEPTGASINALVWDSNRGLVAVGSKDGALAAWLLAAG